jgi:hypothetical protein
VVAAFKNTTLVKDIHSIEVLGCSIFEFKDYILNQNSEFVLNRDNHLDHIIPISLAFDKESVLALSHYTNFRPLSAHDNIVKYNKILPDLIESHFENYQESPAYKFYLENIKNGEQDGTI